MRRMQWPSSLALAVVAAMAARRRGSRRRRHRRKAHADDAHGLGRLERPRAQRVQEGRGRVRRQEPERDGQGRRRDQRRQDHRRAPRRATRPDVAQSFTSSNVGHLLLVGRLDRPRAVPEAGRASTTSIFPAATHVLHAVQGQALRAAAARRHLRPLLQQGRSSRRPGITAPPKTMSELTADAKKLTSATRDGSLKVVGFDPASASTRTRPAHYAAAVRRASGSTRSDKSAISTRPGLGEVPELAEGPDRLLRLRQARAAGRPAPATSSRPPTRSSAASSRW